MSRRNTSDRCGLPAFCMHWPMLLLVDVCTAINLAGAFPRGSTLGVEPKTWHFTPGLVVLVLVAACLTTRLFLGLAPRIEPEIPVWQQRHAKWDQVALYGLLDRHAASLLACPQYQG